LVLVLTLLAAGCSRADDGQQAQTVAVRPCALVTKSEVETALERTVGNGTVLTGVPPLVVGEQVCQFPTTSTDAAAALAKVGAVTAFAPLLFTRFKTEHPQAMAVPELGREAVWDELTSALVVLEDDKILTVVVFGPGVTNHRDRAVKLAEKALDRL
jgi:hypothetical protein